MKNQKNWLGILAITLIFGLVVLGCVKGKSNSGNARISRGVQLYNPVGTAYTGNGALQVVNGWTDFNVGDLGKIGEISPDGKLTLELPDTIPDNFLIDIGEGFKWYLLETSPSITLANDNTALMLLYSDSDFSGYDFYNNDFSGDFFFGESSVNLKKGWNYLDNDSLEVITDLTGYKWIYGSHVK